MKRLLLMVAMFNVQCSMFNVYAQINIGGNVYGGGNAGETKGNTKVTVRAGDIDAVFGGARMADVKGNAFVNIDCENASSYIVINKVYGGNDISGKIGADANVKALPIELKQANENSVTKDWDAFVRISTKMTTNAQNEQVPDETQKTYIGQLFAGGNGEYYYKDVDNKHNIYNSEKDYIDGKDPIASNTTGFTLPDIDKTYLEILGGSIVYAYGGGNNATVTGSTVICVDNPSKVVNHIIDATNPNAGTGGELLTTERFRDKMGINMGFSQPSSDEFQIGRFFGGNNKAEMTIRPIWNLKSGLIRNLYSGGNQGAMALDKCLFLPIRSDGMKIDNVYGGCRMADVNPDKRSFSEETFPDGIHLPGGYAACVLVEGGDINNVYGGNDISGKIYGGSLVGIHSSIKGDVYGGGNGSYPYTDNEKLKGDDIYGDLYYGDFYKEGKDAGKFSFSVDALNAFRPNAEQVSIRVVGTENKKTIIGGAIYCGGNSATLSTDDPNKNAAAELKIGSYVLADKVFLGNNGANMVKSENSTDILQILASKDKTGDNTKFNSMDLIQKAQFDKYMDGVTMKIMPRVVFDDETEDGYKPYSTMFGSFYCGGNVGSVEVNGAIPVDFNDKVVIFDKVVGGCNDANVTKTNYNAAYEGGLLGSATNGNKLILNFNGLKIQPKRWKDPDDKSRGLEWNTFIGDTKDNIDPQTAATGTASDNDLNRRLKGGNIYGGCYNSGHIDGNVIININGTIVDREQNGDEDYGVFDSVLEDGVGEAILYDNDSYHITKRRSGVILDEQGMDVLGSALNVFGGGYGEDSEIWGSTTINLNKGYVFQIFGGGEMGAIGKGTRNATTGKLEYNGYDPKYSTTINVHGSIIGASKQAERRDDMAEAEFIYGGGFEGLIVGDTRINLGNCRVFNTFAGSCNADILGHTETYVGQWTEGTTTKTGFPWIRDHIYGGNDLGGRILGSKNFTDRVSTEASGKMYNGTGLTTASAYMEYVQGRVDNIFGGCYGDYDYSDSEYTGRVTYRPFLDNAFVNFRPNTYSSNAVKKVFGAGQGHTGERDGDKCQNRSYVLIDIPQNLDKYTSLEVFGAGSYNGLGMGYTQAATTASDFDLDQASAIVDLIRGKVSAAYGASYNEGITRRTLVNVPSGSTIKIGKIFGGAYGVSNEVACDAYEATVNYSSSDAEVSAIYGGNNSCRRTLYGTVNINCPVWSNKAKGYQATVYGAGFGVNTWSQYTEVNLNNGAVVYEAYGGGENGQVLNTVSVTEWANLAPSHYAANLAEYNADMTAYVANLAAYETAYAQYLEDKAAYEADPEDKTEPKEPVKPIAPEKPIESLFTDLDGYEDKGLSDAMARSNRLHSVDATRPEKYNTNVHIYEGATVTGYCYGGGLGDGRIKHSGNVYGTTYIDLLGGTVAKDLYAAGTTGSVKDSLAVGNATNKFIAGSTAYIEGGTARNVYGGGWKGSVGQHNGAITTSYTNDILGETHVIIGKLNGTSFINGIPAIERNAYGGGEGGAVFGTTNITLNKGFIGYRHFDAVPTTDTDLDYIQVGSDYYQEKLHDETWKGDGTNRLNDSGNIFGGGYIDNSNVDVTHVKMYGGHVRNALFGGGEIAAIGRGIINASGQDNSIRELQGIYKAGKTNVELYKGHVHRNVFGGGRGYNNLGEGGTLYSDGYVFGQTEVNIYGGEVGTSKELTLGNGNVFGGGDIGYVYSAKEENGVFSVGVKDGERYDGVYEGYYYKFNLNEGESYNAEDATAVESKGQWDMDGNEFILTEDCKVLVEPRCKVTSAVNINNHDYAVGDYVSTEDLNTMKNKNSDRRWSKLDVEGIIIHNAVFAGGNTSSGSSSVFANTTTVFGNVTASVHDVYHRDLITLGTGHTGGIYGDGNLTFVDGYRGLNITNYGTDYYTISSNPEITIEEYHALDAREAAYYQLTYKCKQECTDDDGTTYHTGNNDGYSKASTLTADDIFTLFANQNNMFSTDKDGNKIPNPAYWEENGVCTIYAGRLMNTIQRADFCGVFGSRMVLQGAQDRVPEIVDYKYYTINRVREVSLNQQRSVISDDLELNDPAAGSEDYKDVEKAIHGNYFGIYNIVNYLGALSSDMHFTDVRQTDNRNADAYKSNITLDGNTYAYGSENATYYNWKRAHVNDQKRNNGKSLNKVALASGVYLELTTEESTGNDLYEKVWGPITGVIELDLINVQPGIGGGFVYAKNEHRKCRYVKKNHSTLAWLNQDAITHKDIVYEDEMVEWETQGNFVHSEQTIVDDCYNISGKYQGNDAVPAHYWFIKGSVYVYDQYISAYTGAPNAYSETVDIPLTITAASHGTMKLLNVKTNLFAYKNTNGEKLKSDQKLIINDVTYQLNDPISYWEWNKLTNSEKNLFVAETYVVVEDCWIGDTEYPAGFVMDEAAYSSIRGTGTTPPTVYQKVTKENGDIETKNVPFDSMFRSSNNLGHDTGFILTYKVNNPIEWDTWYTKAVGQPNEKVKAADYNNQTGYEDGPTYHLNSTTGELLGQIKYVEGNIINEDVYKTYQAVVNNENPDIRASVPTNDTSNPNYNPELKQATFERAYIVTQKIDAANGHLNPGTTISATQAASYSSSVEEAFICTSTIQLSPTEFIYINTKMTEDEKNDYISSVNSSIKSIAGKVIDKMNELTSEEQAALSPENKKKLSALLMLKEDIKEQIKPAYYCTDGGLYGGNYYQGGINYRGLIAWSSMSQADRAKFTFNYDALDLLIDPNYGGTEGRKYQYDGNYTTEDEVRASGTGNPAGYSLSQAVDYTATYQGSETATYNTITLQTGKEYKRTEFEKLPNEKRHYAAINVDKAGTIYVVNRSIQIGNTPYAVGATITANAYNSLGDSDKQKITPLEFTTNDVGETFYYCRESYTVGHNGSGEPVTNTKGTQGFDKDGNSVVIKTEAYNNNEQVPIGLVINSDNYEDLVNKQVNFTIHGKAPTETSTLYVSRNSDINDLSTEKIITVVYEYAYEESDESATHVTPISERHVVNIHLQFKSGSPTVEDIMAPQIVIPGDYVRLRDPHVIPGATEVTGGGWELFEKESDAESHTNGIPYTPGEELYWYQDGYWLEYYALSYIGGKTYSNKVPVSVANYHDLKAVMDDKQHHYYVDIPDLVRLKRVPKIYINDYSAGSQDGLDILKNLYDLSLLNSTSEGVTDGVVTAEGKLKGHSLLGDQVKEGQNLEFIFRTNINHGGSAWTPIANTYEGHNEGCFAGVIHGDGHYVSGLTQSLFGSLCGDVYNLGVRGSFTGAGIAETGNGYVENCWVSSNSTRAKTSKPVFGNPTIGENTNRPYRIVNCYYQEEDNATYKYTNHNDSYGIPTRKPKQAFYNGEVAYDLNGFFLYKRYCDQKLTSGTANTSLDGHNSLAKTPKYYGSDADLCSAGYVENRFADGDFIYAEGEIPEDNDLRLYTDPTTKETSYYPIWPDDYIFFGQSLNYDHIELPVTRVHQDWPSDVIRSNSRIETNVNGNRVFRAPAYFRNSEMSVAHFNPYAVFAQTKKGDANTIAYKDMTAIDFTGHNDPGYAKGINGNYFYTPLLDDDGLSDFQNIDLTQNLLVYTSASGGTGSGESPTAAQQTANVVSDYLSDEAYSETNTTYRTVGYRDPTHIRGHWVQQSGSDYVALRDHLLVDRQDFYCPIKYYMGSGKRMWYQRTPDRFVDQRKGWEGVCLPFETEIVTTQGKGELTHFYQGSTKGHEYWLRELGEIRQKKNDDGTDMTGVMEADFNPLAAGGNRKEYTNTFLWDYYYSQDSYYDRNRDEYQKQYYSSEYLSNLYPVTNYPYSQAGTPYLVGFPGKTYYEFDLSGEWTPANRVNGVTITSKGKQTVTFASVEGTSIDVSDGETGTTADGYTYKTNYLNQVLASDAYVMNAAGSSFDLINAATPVSAFRPYFVKSGSGTRETRSIIFGNEQLEELKGVEQHGDPRKEEINGGLRIWTKKDKIFVESTLSFTEDVRVVTPAGITVATFSVKPGQTVEVQADFSGMYIVHTLDGRYTKKLSVKK